jgi:transposase-like protein
MGTSSPAVIEAVTASKVLPTAHRQRRSPESKRKIVEETLVPGASVARIARARSQRQPGISVASVYRAGKLGNPIASAARLLPVTVSETQANNAILPAAADTTSHR